MGRMLSLLLAILLANGGCAGTTNRFRVVDAVTGRPIQNVTVEGQQGMWQPAAPGLFPIYFPFQRSEGMTDNTGLVAFSFPASEVEFRSPGYQPCSLVSGWRGYRERATLFEFNVFPWEDDKTILVRLKHLE